jgi:hypothetical protein
MAWIFDTAQRAQRLSRSSPVAVALLVGSNLVPLLGVLFLGWDLGLILTAYWIENGVVGAINIAKIALTGGDAGRGAWASKAYAMFFFTIHYGTFWLGHGMLVGVVAAVADQGGFDVQVGEGAFIGPFGFPLGAWGLDPLVLGLVALALAVSHGVSFWVNFLGKGEYRSATAQGQMWAPYGRMMVLHLTLLGGAFVLAEFGAPVGPIAVMVVVKTVLDLALHLWERERAAARLAA